MRNWTGMWAGGTMKVKDKPQGPHRDVRCGAKECRSRATNVATALQSRVGFLHHLGFGLGFGAGTGGCVLADATAEGAVRTVGRGGGGVGVGSKGPG